MTAGLETFAKVRALHDRATIPGEKAAAMTRMQTLARKAGMSVDEAVSRLDASKPAPRNIFDELFNSPEFRAQKAEREQRYAERRTAALTEYGSEEAVWQPNEREQALTRACQPFIVRKPIINGEMDTLLGWDTFSRWAQLPFEVRQAVADAYGAPASVRAAWAEFKYWEKVADDRTAFFDCYDHDVRVRARTRLVEYLLDTLPARSMNDLRARIDWMQYINEREWNRGNPEDSTLLATLRADIERMGERIRERQEGEVSTSPVQSGQAQATPGDDRKDVETSLIAQPGQSRNEGDVSTSPIDGVQSGQSVGHAAQHTPSGPSPVQSGHAHRTNADKRRDVAALLTSDESLTDREIARRAGVSPTTVGTIRRSLA